MGSDPAAVLTPRSEPEVEQQAGLEAGLAAATYSKNDRTVSRSCYSCNNKKIRCDKKEPCASCTRAGRPCAFPPLGPRTRRTKKTIMVDMAARISSLEKSLAEARDREASASMIPITDSARPRTASHEGSREDIFVQKGSSSQYFNEVLFSKLIEEERNIESVLTTPQLASSHRPVSSPFNSLGIFSSPSISIVPASLHPPRHLAVRLWNIYVDNVESCAGLKVLHLPTDEVKVYSTIDDPIAASPENLAINFAIYFASTVSIDAAEAQITLGQDKNMLLPQFKLGLEQAFAHGNFLDCPTLIGLHAFAIYLSALRVHNHGKGIWILNGLAIRMAQSIGLHRDGEQLNLSPFQSEIRRRLWWHLLSRDGRAGEDYGLQNMDSLLLVSDVSLPLNIDDTDIHPEMQRLPEGKAGWTAMTFSLITIGLVKSMHKLATITVASPPSSPLKEEVRVQIINEAKADAEKWLVHCNPVIPRQCMTLFCARFLLRKIDFITRLQCLLSQNDSSHADFATEQNLVEALDLLEERLCTKADLLKQFSWVRKAYPQYHAIMFVLWHLCVKPEGPSVDRAWKVVEDIFSHELWDESTIGFRSKPVVLTALKAKAMAVRERLHNPHPGENARDSDRTSNLPVTEGGSSEGESLPPYPFCDMGGDQFGLDSSGDEWSNWATLVQGLQSDSPDVLWQ